MSLSNIYFILVRPQLGENIGSVARAIKNFNIKYLRIVNPRCNWPNQKALATSVGAKDILKSAKIYDSVEKSIGDLDIIFASSSRIRKVNKKIISIYDLHKKIKKKHKIGIIFGAEASGLTNDENGSFDLMGYYLGYLAWYWTSTSIDSDLAWSRELFWSGSDIHRHSITKNYGISVRCLSD